MVGGEELWKRRGRRPLGKRCAFPTFPQPRRRRENGYKRSLGESKPGESLIIPGLRMGGRSVSNPESTILRNPETRKTLHVVSNPESVSQHNPESRTTSHEFSNPDSIHLHNPRSAGMMDVIRHRGGAKLLCRKHLPVFHKRQPMEERCSVVGWSSQKKACEQFVRIPFPNFRVRKH